MIIKNRKKYNHLFMAAIYTLLFLAFLVQTLPSTEAQIGVCYGKAGTNMPSAQDTINLCLSNGIENMRIYDLDLSILQAVQGSSIKLILGVPNEYLQSVGTSPSAARDFVGKYVVPYASSIKYIAVGNEVPMSSTLAQFVGPAMQNVQNALNSVNLSNRIKVSTSISTSLVINSYPPSKGEFSNMGFMGPVANFLESNGSPLLLNVYSYFAYATSSKQNGNVDLSYALFTYPGTAFTDSNNALPYQNLFDALVDSTYAALRKAGAPHTRIAASESGWPSGIGRHPHSHANDGDSGATPDNAATYYKNLVKHVRQGTPLRPGEAIETYMFALFDEDQKPGNDVEQHFGIFSPYQKPKYDGLLTPGQKPKYDACLQRM